MKTFAIVLTAGLLAVAQAQEQCAAVAAQIPACAVSCIGPAAAKVGCGETDFACQCKPANNAAINSAALSCVLSGCGPVTGLSVQASASAVCACAASAGPASSTAAAPASTPAVATTSAAPVATSSPAAVVASSAAPAKSASSAASNPVSTSGAVAATGSPASTGTATSPSVAAFTGAGFKAVASVGGVVGALLAVIVAL